MPAFQPYRGKPAVRNVRGDRGNVGIIRSPVRASILPDRSRPRGQCGYEDLWRWRLVAERSMGPHGGFVTSR